MTKEEVREIAVRQMRLTPEFRKRAARVLEERGANPFEARRFFRLPPAAQVVGIMVLEEDASRSVRELIAELEEDAERVVRRAAGIAD